ncbi:MAG: hypothetical protein HFE98_03585 [Ruminiclostridium sp.]|jgi:hypothetical protein|nr:hypothetical protein [Ruminiclostridium sp.]MCI9466636.1 hypothetical protein [Ruminiclostridium sp.]
MKKYFLPLCALLCALLCACGPDSSAESQTPQEDTSNILSTETVQRPARTAVLLEDATLTQCYGALADTSMQLSWTAIEGDVPMVKGDVVLVLETTGEQSRVYVPTGDTPNALYGTLPAAILSQSEEDLENSANLALADGCLGQNTETQEVEQMLGTVKVLVRDGSRCKVQNLVGGDTRSFWVKTSDLSYDMDSLVADRGDIPKTNG